MSDHFSDFDARRIGWWARRAAVRRIRRATGITDADRSLRVQQASAAQTRGEISALTRGLSPTGPAPAWTPPRAEQRTSTAQQPAGRPPMSSWTPPAQQAPIPQPFAQQPAARKKSARGPLLIGLVIVVLMCGGGIVSGVTSVVDTVQEGSSSSVRAEVPDPQTEAGWDAMVDELDSRVDLSKTIGLLVRQDGATLTVADGDTAAARYSYDGDVTATTEVRRLPTEQLFDLTDIDSSVIVRTLARARRSSGEPESSQAWVQVWAFARGTRIVVTFPDGASGTYAMVVDTDGELVSETP